MCDQPCRSTQAGAGTVMDSVRPREPKKGVRVLWTKAIEGSDVKSSNEYVLDLRRRLDDTLEIVCQELQKSQAKQKDNYDRTVEQMKFCIGDKMLPTESYKSFLQI
ncbi:reverse transcriptase [Plakobranchus ocellatus]|uniref:Reverse transcriptase n=1 Tax=Plakobranchus ocellatus TaxID=259542 RepID=A0AAV4D903_9GAST|nr:reverse transcriptase [Plakobranchus ocellatus]